MRGFQVRGSLFAFVVAIGIIGCGRIDRGLNAVDNAINEVKKTNTSFEDIKKILEGLKGNLDKGEYRNQVDDLLGRTSQVAQLGVQGSIDFTRTRVREDLENLRRSMTGEPSVTRVPILCNPQSPKVDFTSPARSSLTIVGWNLDVAQKNPERYRALIKNTAGADRVIDRKYLTFQGQYALTLDISGSGIPLQHYDSKVIFEGFDPLFELAILNTQPPAPPERITDVSGTIRTTNQDREGGFCRLELWDGDQLLWQHQFPEKPRWRDWHSEPFHFGGLSLPMPANPRFLVVLSQAGARERNILWRFEAKAEFQTDRRNILGFDQVGLSLHCGDGRPATVRTAINRVR